MSDRPWKGDPEAIIAALEQLGWSSALDAAVWRQMRARIEKTEEGGGRAYVGIASFDFDTEAIDGCGPDAAYGSYHAIIELYARHSQGKFVPQNIVDAWIDDNTRARVGFSFGDQKHEVVVKLDADWFQDEVHELINGALEKAGVEERFLLVPVLDQAAYVAFLSPDLFEQAEKAGVIPSFRELAAEEM